MNIYQCERRLTDCQCILHVCKEIRFHFYTQSLIWRWHTKVIHISSKLFTLSMLEWNSSRVHMFAFTIWMELKKKEKRKHLQTSRACVPVPRIAREWLVPFWCIYVNWAIQNNETKTTSIVCIFGGGYVVVHLRLLLLHLLLLPSRNLCYLVMYYDCACKCVRVCSVVSFVVNFKLCMSMRKEITKIQLQSIIWFFISWMCWTLIFGCPWWCCCWCCCFMFICCLYIFICCFVAIFYSLFHYRLVGDAILDDCWM